MCPVRIKPVPHLSRVCTDLSAGYRAAWRAGGREPVLPNSWGARPGLLRLFTSHPHHFPGFCPCRCQHLSLQLWLLLCPHLETSLHLYLTSSAFCSSGKAHGGFAEISCINITLTVSASKLMAVTVEKAKSSWKRKMALTQPQMLWLAGIEVGKSLIRE